MAQESEHRNNAYDVGLHAQREQRPPECTTHRTNAWIRLGSAAVAAISPPYRAAGTFAETDERLGTIQMATKDHGIVAKRTLIGICRRG